MTAYERARALTTSLVGTWLITGLILRVTALLTQFL
jgi:hypothetical protein